MAISVKKRATETGSFFAGDGSQQEFAIQGEGDKRGWGFFMIGY